MHSDSKTKSPIVLLLRHAETDYPKGRYYADEIEDPPLNTVGLKQAEKWENQLKENNRSISGVYVSPSRRTQDTAEISARSLGLKMETIDGLRERSFGKWGGLTAEEIRMQFPDEWSAWREDKTNFIPSGGESLVGFSIRVKETMRKLVSRHPAQTFLVVTHVGPIRMIVTAALGIPLMNFKRLIITNCSMTEVEYTDQWPNLHSLSLIP